MSYLITYNGWYLIGINSGNTIQNTIATLINTTLHSFIVNDAYCVKNNYQGIPSPSPGNFTVSEWKDMTNLLTTNFPYTIGVWVNITLTAPQSPTAPAPVTPPSAGRVVDGYVSGAQVYQGATYIGITDSTGNFDSSNITYDNSIITATGGTVIDTGLPNKLTLKALAKTGSTVFVMSPLTTLVVRSSPSKSKFISNCKLVCCKQIRYSRSRYC